MDVYLFDIDGTLSDPAHRLHHIQKEPKDWDAFFDACVDDQPHMHIIGLVQALDTRGTQVVLMSGRSDRVRHKTVYWLAQHGLYACPLYMRKDGDHRPDDLVKAELLEKIRADGYEPIMAFDDRTQCVNLWRAKGIPCAQVADGDF